MTDKPIAIFGIPVRLDSTLCDPGEVFLESPDGTVTRLDGIEPVDDDDDPDMDTEL